MEEENNQIKDIAEELLIINKKTIDTLFKLNDCVDCIALYVFYYKTMKWQKTNQIKATDKYVMKSLKWGKSRLTKIKQLLKEYGLIDIVQSRTKGKINAWYIKVSYLINHKTSEEILNHGDYNQEYCEPEVLSARSGCENTSALNNIYNKCLNNYNINKKELSDDLKVQINKVLNYFNNCGEINNETFTKIKSYNISLNNKEVVKIIKARLNEGYTVSDLCDVIFIKYKDFIENEFTINNKSSVIYYYPTTLFAPSKIGKYLNEYKVYSED